MKKFIFKQLLFLVISIFGWLIMSGKILRDFFGSPKIINSGCPSCYSPNIMPYSAYIGAIMLIIGLLSFEDSPISTLVLN